MSKKPGVGVVVGRFQIDNLHAGHRAVLDAANRHHKLLVFIGSHPFNVTKENPLDYPTRECMIKADYPNAIIMPQMDHPSDFTWSMILDGKIYESFPHDEVTMYCGRDGFAPHYCGKNKIVAVDTVAPESGTDIRFQVGQTIIPSREFRRGVIYASNNQYPLVKTAVDIAAFSENRILLGRKKEDGKKFRFPGGFVDATDDSFEFAAKRELFEETGLCTPLDSLWYVGSFRIDDWRRTKSCNIYSCLYFTDALEGGIGASAADDLHECRWVEFTKMNLTLIADPHKPLYEALLTYRMNEVRKKWNREILY